MDKQKDYDIFISWASDKWSCDNSNGESVCVGATIAEILSEFIETISDSLNVYFSRKIKTGEWDAKLLTSLQQCQLGIFIMTEPALDSSWVIFEFAALKLSTNYKDTDNMVIFKISNGDYDKSQSPITDLNTTFTNLDNDGIKALLETIKRCFNKDFDVERKCKLWSQLYACRVNKAVNNIKNNYVRHHKLNNIIIDKEQEIEALRKQFINNKDIDIEKLQKEITILQKNNKELVAQKNALYKNIEQKNRELSNLSETIAKQDIYLNNLKDEKDCLISKLRTAEQTLKDLKEQYKFPYIDLGLPSGTLWATCNIGADNPWDYGDYFAWGEIKIKDSFSWYSYKYAYGAPDKLWKYCSREKKGNLCFTDMLRELVDTDDAAIVNVGEEWRIPTSYDFQELIDNCVWEWSKKEEINGYVITSKKYVGNEIFIPAAGIKGFVRSLKGEAGYYWSSSLYEDEPERAKCLFFKSNCIDENYWLRFCGLPIRPVLAKTKK